MSLRRIEDKLEQVSDCLIRMEVNVDRNTDDLAEHIKRTNLIVVIRRVFVWRIHLR